MIMIDFDHLYNVQKVNNLKGLFPFT